MAQQVKDLALSQLVWIQSLAWNFPPKESRLVVLKAGGTGDIGSTDGSRDSLGRGVRGGGYTTRRIY